MWVRGVVWWGGGNTGHILVLRRSTCALMRAKTSAVLRRKTGAVLGLIKAHVLALNTAQVLRLNKADVLALNKAHVSRLNPKICPVFTANTKQTTKGGRLSAAHLCGGGRGPPTLCWL